MSIEAMKLALDWIEGNGKYEDGDSIATALRQAIEQAQKQEPVAWRNAALRVGEDLFSVGPFGYYDMTAEQWLEWALSVVTVHAPPPQRQPLTDERCGGCEACIDSACGREDCPKGWKESASVAYIRGLEDGARQNREPLTDEKIINEADRFDWDKDCAVRFARAIEAAHGIKGGA